MSEMVERVAKAISGSGVVSTRSLAKARSALKAMREPTEAMLGALLEVDMANADYRHLAAKWTTRFNAAIDAALSEPEK